MREHFCPFFESSVECEILTSGVSDFEYSDVAFQFYSWKIYRFGHNLLEWTMVHVIVVVIHSLFSVLFVPIKCISSVFGSYEWTYIYFNECPVIFACITIGKYSCFGGVGLKCLWLSLLYGMVLSMYVSFWFSTELTGLSTHPYY